MNGIRIIALTCALSLSLAWSGLARAEDTTAPTHEHAKHKAHLKAKKKVRGIKRHHKIKKHMAAKKAAVPSESAAPVTKD